VWFKEGPKQPDKNRIINAVYMLLLNPKMNVERDDSTTVIVIEALYPQDFPM
jgi:hypothetical protein